LKLKFQTVAEKTAKNFRGLLYFAAPGISSNVNELYELKKFLGLCTLCIINMLVELTRKNKT